MFVLFFQRYLEKVGWRIELQKKTKKISLFLHFSCLYAGFCAIITVIFTNIISCLYCMKTHIFSPIGEKGGDVKVTGVVSFRFIPADRDA